MVNNRCTSKRTLLVIFFPSAINSFKVFCLKYDASTEIKPNSEIASKSTISSSIAMPAFGASPLTENIPKGRL